MRIAMGKYNNIQLYIEYSLIPEICNVFVIDKLYNKVEMKQKKIYGPHDRLPTLNPSPIFLSIVDLQFLLKNKELLLFGLKIKKSENITHSS